MRGKLRLSVSIILALLTTVAPVFHIQQLHAAPGLNNRSLLLATTQVSASTTHDFQFDITIGGNIGSIRFQYCSNNPLPFLPCTAPNGFDISGATLANQTGETGFSIDGSTTANDLLLSRAPAAATPQAVAYSFDDVVNPDTVGSYFVRLLTYPTLDGTGPSTEEAGLAFAITEDFSVVAFVPPYLMFCVGITITSNNCATASGDSVDFGILSEDTTRTATSQANAGTNGPGGVAISVIGTTMTSGVHTIDALSPRGFSQTGTNQFGLNVRNNSSPNIGAEPTGPGTTVGIGDYGFINQFAFNNGDVIANSPISTNFSTLTISYIVNIDEDQNPGVYTSTLTYVATATF